MDLISLAILALCLITLLIYLRTRKYDSPQGILMLALGLAAVLLKLYFRDKSSYLFNPSTFIHSGIIITSFTALICLLLVLLKKNKLRWKYALTLLPLYLFWGFLQQLLFQYLFLESVYTVVGNIWLAIIIGAVFYLLFHFNLDFDAKFRLGLFIIDLFWGYFYLTYQNIFWLGISHGIFGVAYYTLVCKMDPLKIRFSNKTRKIVPKY